MKNDFLKIRKTHKDDWESIKKIYTLGLNTGVASFETEVSKTIVGWITLSKVSSRCCYEGVGEVSIYMHPMHQRNGFATLLYNHLEKNASSSGYWTIQAQLFTENTASKSLFESLQFRQVGIREKIGKYKDKWVDNYLYEKNIL